MPPQLRLVDVRAFSVGSCGRLNPVCENVDGTSSGRRWAGYKIDLDRERIVYRPSAGLLTLGLFALFGGQALSDFGTRQAIESALSGGSGGGLLMTVGSVLSTIGLILVLVAIHRLASNVDGLAYIADAPARQLSTAENRARVEEIKAAQLKRTDGPPAPYTG